MPTPDAALAHFTRQQRLTAAALLAARSSWQRLNPNSLDASWQTIAPRILVTTSAIQRAAALDAIAYVPSVLGELGIDSTPAGRVVAGQFVGVASDGRTLDTLLREPLIRTKQLFGAGASSTEAMAGGLAMLERILATQIPDAARGATSVAITARPRVGYVRMLSTPSCSRCAVLAGKWFRFNQGFQRHPRCDCRHIPATEDVAGDLTTDPRKAIEQGQVTGLSKADTRAILEDHADVGQVINARRGMTAAGTTTEGTTRRGFAGKRLGVQAADRSRAAGTRFGNATAVRARSAPRLMPERIYQIAGDDRERAINLLRRNGFLI